MVLPVFLSAMLSAALVGIDEVDSSDSAEETWYCYGNIMILKYPYDETDLTIDWDVTGYYGGVSADVQYYSGATVPIDVSGYDHVIVRQTVTNGTGTESDSKTIDVIPPGLRSGESITVRFMDGTRELSRCILDSSRSVLLGSSFVDLPVDPSKTNYRFTG